MTKSDRSSSLDQEETNRLSQIPTTYRRLLSSIDPDEYAASQLLYLEVSAQERSQKLATFENCRRHAFFVRHLETGEVRVRSNHCNLKWCPICARSKARGISNNVREWVMTLDAPKLLTLTLRHSTADLSNQVDDLLRFFRNWRRLTPMSKAYAGGVWFLQITYNVNTDTWHPHLHVILDGGFVNQKTLSERWNHVTHGSSIVDVRRIKNPEYAARYVARYVARPVRLADVPADRRTAIYWQLQGRRTCGTFGTARRAALTSRPSFDSTKWRSVGTYTTVLTLAPRDDRAQSILSAWVHHTPLDAGVCVYDPVTPDPTTSFDHEPEPPPKQLDLESWRIPYGFIS